MEKDDDKNKDGNVSRRDFTALSVAAAVAAGSGPASAALAVTESDVMIKTPDGVCDAAFIRPSSGSHPGVIVWTDIFGLRPSFRDLGKRLAGRGYAVLIPNPFYRTAKSPVIEDASTADFQRSGQPGQNRRLGRADQPARRDRAGRCADLSRSWTRKRKSTPPRKSALRVLAPGRRTMVFKTAATNSSRVGAGATFHGGGLVTDKPDSPHLLASKMKSRMYIAIAASDDSKQPDAKDKLKAAFAAANVPAEVTVYDGTIHGWTVRDMPKQDGKPIYNPPEAERAWAKLLALYKASIA